MAHVALLGLRGELRGRFKGCIGLIWLFRDYWVVQGFTCQFVAWAAEDGVRNRTRTKQNVVSVKCGSLKDYEFLCPHAFPQSLFQSFRPLQ